MKPLLNVTLLLNFLVEAPVGAALALAPQNFLAPDQVAGALWARNYGVAAFAVASLSIWLWPKRHDLSSVSLALGFFITFHPLLAIALLTSGDQTVGVVIHTVLSVSFILLFFTRERWCAAAPQGA